MFLVDTDVVSELRRKRSTHPGVIGFFKAVAASGFPVFLAAITIGELRRGVEIIRHRGDDSQAALLERWLNRLLEEFGDSVLPFDADVAQIWGRLRVPHAENPLDKQIAATALVHDLTLVTRNVRHFAGTGVRLLDPFAQ